MATVSHAWGATTMPAWLCRLSKMLPSIPTGSIFKGHLLWGAQILTAGEGGGANVTHWNPPSHLKTSTPRHMFSETMGPKS